MLNFLKNKSNFFIPSLANILFFVLFLNLSLYPGAGLLNDADTGWHIRMGEHILNTLSVPKHDIFSFSNPPLHWLNSAWLSDVIMALIHSAFGLTGVVIFFAFLISIVYFLLFKIVIKQNGNIIFAVFIVLLTTASSSLHWLARPHIFSLLLMVIFYYLLDVFQYAQKNYLYLLPPIMLLWINLHGGFISGFVLMGIYLFANFIKFFFTKREEKAAHKEKTKLLGLTTAVCLLISLINPYSYHTLFYPFKLMSYKFIIDNVMEFHSPNFHNFSEMFYLCLLLLMILVIGISKKRVNMIEIALIIVFTYMALYSVRCITLFGIVVAPILARQAEMLLKQGRGRFVDFFQKRASNIALVDASARGYLWPVTAVLIAVFFASTGRIEFKFSAERNPVAAVAFLKKVHLKGNMFNNDEFGDYLIYSAYPQYKVFIDDRLDMYGTDRVKEYLEVTDFKPEWEKIIEKYQISWIIFNSDSRLSRFLMEKNEWKLIYADKVANIFIKNIPENQQLINQYTKPKPVIVEDKNEKSMK